MVVSAQYAEKGFIYPAPKPKEEHAKFVSLQFLDRYSGRISERLRLGATLGVLTALDRKMALGEIPKGLLGTLKAFEDDLHFETQEAIGRVKQAEGDLDGARQAYERAERIVRDDPKIDSGRPPWSETIAKLKARCASLDKIVRPP
jgi:hypothetical protein